MSLVTCCCNGGNCLFDVMLSFVLVFICLRKLSTLLLFCFFVEGVLFVSDDTEDDGVNSIVVGGEIMLGI